MEKNRTLTFRITLGVGVILLAILSAVQMLPPRSISREAPATRFSAERAMADLDVVAAVPHPAGSDAQAKVRSYIVNQVEALGLKAEIETSGQVSNILVRIPGADPTLAVLVSAHYDSHPPAPGAGDNGISVVAMLESIRVLHASPPLRNDVLFLFTDGEELGWKGARAFLDSHPQAKDETGVLMVFDALPGNAPLNLLETSPGDAWLVRQLTGMPLYFWAASWKNIQERNEIDTDYDTFQPAGFTGLAIENEANGTRYHTARDTVSAISPDLVQAVGQSLLALTHRFGAIDLRTQTQGPDLVFFTLSLVGLVAYPYWVMTALSSLGILFLLVFIIIAWRVAHLSLSRFLLALLGLLVAILIPTVCAQLVWGIIVKDQAAGIAASGRFEGSAAWQAGLMVASCLLLVILLIILSRRLGGIYLACASPLLFLMVAFAFNFMTHSDNPLTTAWLAWPFIGGVMGLGVLLFTRDRAWKVMLLLLSALLILAVTVPRLWLGTFTAEDAWLPVVVVCIWTTLLASLIYAIFGQGLQPEGQALP